MEESEGGGVVGPGTDCPTTATTTTTTSLGDGECDESSVVQEPRKKKQKKSRKDRKNFGLNHDCFACDEQQLQFYIPAAGASAEHKSNKESEAGGGEIDENGGGRGGGVFPVEIPPNSLQLSEVVETTENEDEEADVDEDDGEGELIPEFDPDEKGTSLFTEELRAAVEEGSVLQLPPMMAVLDPHFPAEDQPQQHQPQLLVPEESIDIVHMNGGGLPAPFALTMTVPPTNGSYEGVNDHLDAIAYKIYTALQQATNSYPPAVTSQSPQREGSDHYPQPVDQEQGGDKNHPGGGVDEGERTPRHPRWTREETAVLLAGKRKRDEEIRAMQSGSKFANATERWDSISNYCKAHGVDRDAHQCRKRWSNLAADFKKIRTWHKVSGVEPYWSMRGDNRRKNKLPGSFDPEVFADMEATSDANPHKKRKLVPTAGDAEDVEEHQHDPLASVMESSGRAMQAALARNIQAQIEAHNQNSELDRNQRKEQGDNLVGVLGLLAESLAKIAEKL